MMPVPGDEEEERERDYGESSATKECKVKRRTVVEVYDPPLHYIHGLRT